MKWPGMQKWTQKDGIIVPKHIIKERIDEAHRRDWEDPDRYERQKAKALRYIEARAAEIEHFAWEKLLGEVVRVFHNDLATDSEVREAAQRCCWAAEQQHLHDRDLDVLPPEAAADPDAGPDAPRGEVRGVDDSDETLENLEWQQREEEREP